MTKENNNLTRAQFALMIARTLELEATEVVTYQMLDTEYLTLTFVYRLF